MTISCTPKELATALKTVSPAVGKNSYSMPILNNVHLGADSNGTLAIAASNLAISIRTWLSATTSQPIAITVPAITLSQLTNLLPGDADLTMTPQENATLHLKCGDQFKANLKGIPAGEFPTIPDYPTLAREQNLPTITIEPADLERALTRTTFSAATDDTRIVLECVYLHTVEGHLAFASADGFRLSAQHLTAYPTDFPHLLIPRSALEQVCRLLANETNPVHIITNKERTQVAFIFNSTHLVTQLVSGNFPDYNSIIPTDHTTQITASSSDLRYAIRAALVFSGSYAANSTHWSIQTQAPNEDEAGSPVTAHPGELIITGQDAETGDHTATIPIQLEGNPIEFSLDGRYVLDVIEAIGPDQVYIRLSNPIDPITFQPASDPTYPITFQPASDPTYTHVIMPQHRGGKS